MPQKSIFSLLVHEVLNPFYIFQVFAIGLWYWDGYFSYAACIFVVSTASVAAELYDNRKNSNQIRKMALYSCPIELKTSAAVGLGSVLEEVNSTELVPGDIVKVPEQCALPCDLVLLTGSAIVNEAILTGESIPVMKSSLPIVSSENYSVESSGKHTLFGGTSVI